MLEAGASELRTDLLNRAGEYFFRKADYLWARLLFERAIAISDKALGPEDPLTAKGLNNLARLLQSQGDLAGAQPLHERALAIREKVLGPEHPPCQ